MSSVTAVPFTVSTRFLVISDTHNFEFEDGETSKFSQKSLPKTDVVLHCGDLTQCGGLSAYKNILNMLRSIDAELKLVIAGNHDLSLDGEHWQTHLDEHDDPDGHSHAIEIWTGELAAEAGVTYLVEGTYSFTLSSGAKFRLYASPYTPQFCDWAFPYETYEDRFNRPSQVPEGVTSIAKHPIPDFPGVDIIMTHGPPRGILDECPQGHKGCDNILRAVRRVKPLMHCFGHIHEGYGTRLIDWEELETYYDGWSDLECDNNAKQAINPYPEPKKCPIRFGKQTLMVNAAIMDGQYKPNNAPWFLELDLPHA